MIYILLGLLILALVFFPSVWVKRILEKYSIPADRYTGSGSELAKYLLKKESLENVSVEITEDGDHYDPEKKVVRLTKT